MYDNDVTAPRVYQLSHYHHQLIYNPHTNDARRQCIFHIVQSTHTVIIIRYLHTSDCISFCVKSRFHFYADCKCSLFSASRPEHVSGAEMSKSKWSVERSVERNVAEQEGSGEREFRKWS